MIKHTTRFLLLVVGVASGWCPLAATPAGGIVVERVARFLAGERAGLQPGDELLSWSRSTTASDIAPTAGTFRWPPDLDFVALELSPRSPVTVFGRRNGQPWRWVLSSGRPGVLARPMLDEPGLLHYREGLGLMEAGEREKGVAAWQESAETARLKGAMLDAAWFGGRMAQALFEGGRTDEAMAHLESTLLLLPETERDSFPTLFWIHTGESCLDRNDLPRSEAAFQHAWRQEEARGRESLALALAGNSLGIAAWRRGDLTVAGDYFRRSQAIREKNAPDSVEFASSLINTGLAARGRGDLDQADRTYQLAIDILEKRAPVSIEMLSALANLGISLRNRGDLDGAESRLRRALALAEKLTPGGQEEARSLLNLGLTMLNRGDLSNAEAAFRRSLEILETSTPGGSHSASCLNNLGLVLQRRGDMAGAERYYKEALAIREKRSPGSPDVATCLNNLGVLAQIRQDYATARGYVEKALAIREKQAPQSLEVSLYLNNLGLLAYVDNDLEKAENYFRRALAIQEKLASSSFTVITVLTNLGRCALQRGDPALAEDYGRRALAGCEKAGSDNPASTTVLCLLGWSAIKRGDAAAAETFFRRALDLRRKAIPDSLAEAETRYALATVFRHTGRTIQAVEEYRRVADALETQTGKLGGTDETRLGFLADYSDLYREWIDLLLAMKQPEDAFVVLERSRARRLLSMLAERDLVFSTDVPPELDRERKLADAAYDRIQEEMAQLPPGREGARRNALILNLQQARESQEEIATRIRNIAPHYASLRYPRPLGLPETRAALDPGTVLLAYCTSAEQIRLFVISGEAGLKVHVLALQGKELDSLVENYRYLLHNWMEGEGHPQDTLNAASRLYEVLIAPAAQSIRGARRILILPDGSLHALPFASLVRTTGRGVPTASSAGVRRNWQYLVEWKPLHTVVSATVYAELRKVALGRSSAADRIVAFGDPRAQSDDHREEPRASGRPASLPAARQEVEALAELFGKQATVYLGSEATEQRVKSLDRRLRCVHFACHGILDERFPLNSGLELARPASGSEREDNGLLQVWEIFEQVRFDADLVTLSACGTGLGKKMGGEGMVGLTRAFQYAGARSVLASLWNVSDESTTTLMKRFYKGLAKGLPKDEALQAAQVALIRQPQPVKTAPNRNRHPSVDTAHPFFGAAFQLYGDWK